jgi:hypothetical protein
MTAKDTQGKVVIRDLVEDAGQFHHLVSHVDRNQNPEKSRSYQDGQ